MQALGLQVEGDQIACALIHENKKEIEIKLLRTFSFEEIAALPELIASLQSEPPVAVTGLEGRDLLIRSLAFKMKSRRALFRVLPFQAQGAIPYPLEETILLPFFEQNSVKLICTTKELLTSHLQKLQTYQIAPDWVSSAPAALVRFAHFLYPDRENLFFCHVGKTESLAGAVVNGKLQECHSLSFGSDEIREYKTDRFKKELDRVLASLAQKTGLPPGCEILVTGDERTEVASYLPSHLTLLFCKEDLAAFALPIGLSLDAIKKDRASVQFLQGAFVPLHVRKRRTKERLFYAAACLILGCATWLGSHLLTKQRESQLKETLSVYLNRPLDPNASLEEELNRWEQSMKQKAASSFHLSVPKVSDLLSWMSRHPLLSSDGSKKEAIDIKRVRYTLVKYPKVGSTNVPYQAKVELEFTASTPKIARDFREALLAGDEMVNAKNETSWNTQENSYITSFFLHPVRQP